MITKILKNFNGYRNYWFPDVTETNLYVNENIRKKYSEGYHERELELLNKWKHIIPKGWYGFSLGQPLNKNWYEIIDRFLEYLYQLNESGKISGFEIHQIKLKFGGIRFHVSYNCDDEELREFIDLQINKLEMDLFDEKLIY